MSSSSNTGTVVGYGTMTNASYEVLDAFGAFVEKVAPQAFRKVLADKRNDTRFQFDHDGMPLARTTNGTLALSEDAVGLYYVADLDLDQKLGNDLYRAIERGDVSQNSIGFIVDRDEWDEAFERRTILSFKRLFDVSAVTFPASPTTWVKVKDADSDAERSAMRAEAQRRTAQRFRIEQMQQTSRVLRVRYGLPARREPKTFVSSDASRRAAQQRRTAIEQAGSYRAAALDEAGFERRTNFIYLPETA